MNSNILKLCEFVNYVLFFKASFSMKEVAGDVVEVLAITLDAEDDVEAHLATLNIINDLMKKSEAESKWLEYFAKLGVYSKVQVMCDHGDAEIFELDQENDTDFIQDDGTAGKSIVKEGFKKVSFSWF